MPVIDLTVRHRRTRDDARRGLELAVQRISDQFGALVRRVEWAPDRHRVKLDGADIPILAGLFGGRLGSGLKQILEQTFQKKLP
jgi:hypothetical protein